jgi:nucleoid DNA-binding protein
MTMREFSRRVSKRTSLKRDLVHQVLASAFKEASLILSEGDEWRLPGFGIFFTARRKARKLSRWDFASNCPSETVLPPHRVVCFRSSASLREEVNRGREAIH